MIQIWMRYISYSHYYQIINILYEKHKDKDEIYDAILTSKQLVVEHIVLL